MTVTAVYGTDITATVSSNTRYLDASDCEIYSVDGGTTTVSVGDRIIVVRGPWNTSKEPLI